MARPADRRWRSPSPAAPVHKDVSTGDDGRDREAGHRQRLRGSRGLLGPSATKRNRRTRRSRSTTPPRFAGSGGPNRRSRSCRGRRSTTPTTAKCSPPTARRSPPAGDLDRALDIIRRAQTPDQPDWRLLSAEAAILDQIGEHDEARKLYAQALDLAPNEPLGPVQSRHVLRADRRARRGRAHPPPGRRRSPMPTAASARTSRSSSVSRGASTRRRRSPARDLSPDQAAANVAYLKSMLAQQNDWKKLKSTDTGKPARGGTGCRPVRRGRSFPQPCVASRPPTRLSSMHRVLTWMAAGR